jgi:hypothetical protein
LLKRCLLFFWALWLTVVFTTNALDGSKALGVLDENWPFASGNFGLVVETTARYGTPFWLNQLLFAGVLCWEGAAALLFWLACLSFRREGRGGERLLYAAFGVSLMLWAAFLIADELCIAYPMEATHLRLFIAQLATLLAIELLPENTTPRRSA